MRNQINSALLARYLSGECGEEQKGKIEAWIDNDPANRRLFEIMKEAWEQEEHQARRSDVSALWQEVAKKAGIDTKMRPGKQVQIGTQPKHWQRTASRFRMWHMAAILTAGTALLYYVSLQRGQELLTINVEPGNRKNVAFSDGSRVALDAGTSMSYPSEFDGRIREVTLKGEGYFEVGPDAEKPFVIHAGDAEIRVLGTRFNVRAWPEDQKVTVTVAEGRVSLRQESGSDGNAVIITKGQQSVFTALGTPTDPADVDLEQELGWMQNTMHFENATLGEILRQLERWYGIRIVLQDETASGQRLTLHIDRQSLDSTLELIMALTELQYSQKDSTIFITKSIKKYNN